MSYKMQVPTVGESITEVTLAAWLKKEGDFVSLDEIICELESDKATFEVPAERDGILHIIAKEGDSLPIGGVICVIDESTTAQTLNTTTNNESISTNFQNSTPTTQAIASGAANGQNPIESATGNTPSAGGEVEEKGLRVASNTNFQNETNIMTPQTSNAPVIHSMKVPTVGESISEITVSSWFKKDGDFVKMDEAICEIESEKATFELTAEKSGILRIKASEGTTLPIGAIICAIEVGENTQAEPAKAPVVSVVSPNIATSTSQNVSGHPSPAAAKILAEKDIETSQISGTGVGGRITKEDAIAAEKQVVAPVTAAPASKPAVKPAEAPVLASGERTERREKMTSLRKTIARRLVAVKNQTAMLTTFNEVDMSAVMELRKKYKDKFKEKHEVGLGFMSFFIRAACAALLEFPAVNAIIDGEEIIYNNFCDVSVAVSTPKGLVVPIIRNAEKLSLAGLEKEVANLALKAREGKLTIPEMTGGTFTITNGGVFGSMLSTPIINAPQSAIIGLHNIVERAVVVNGQVVIRPIMYVALSYDHRIIDGKESVSFLYRIKEMMEDPTRLLLGV